VERHFDDVFHPGFEWRPAIAGLGENLYSGRQGYRAWLADLDGIATEVTLGGFEVTPVGETCLLALGRVRFVGRESGVTLENEIGVVFLVQDGRATSGHAYLSHAEAERAAADVAEASVDA